MMIHRLIVVGYGNQVVVCMTDKNLNKKKRKTKNTPTIFCCFVFDWIIKKEENLQ